MLVTTIVAGWCASFNGDGRCARALDERAARRSTLRMPGTMLITGGGRGIGAATARLAAARGYSVAVNYLKDERAANAVVSEIRASGGSAVAIRADVSHEADVERLFREAERDLAPLSV